MLQDLVLTVLVEEQEQDGFETVDTITLHIDVCSLSNPPQEFDGVYGIASIDLGYQLFITPEEYEKYCTEPSQ